MPLLPSSIWSMTDGGPSPPHSSNKITIYGWN